MARRLPLPPSLRPPFSLPLLAYRHSAQPAPPAWPCTPAHHIEAAVTWDRLVATAVFRVLGVACVCGWLCAGPYILLALCRHGAEKAKDWLTRRNGQEFNEQGCSARGCHSAAVISRNDQFLLSQESLRAFAVKRNNRRRPTWPTHPKRCSSLLVWLPSAFLRSARAPSSAMQPHPSARSSRCCR